MDQSEFSKRIGALLRAAREQGELEPLAHYQRKFKGFEHVVAREYEIVEREARGPASSRGLAHDWVPSKERGDYTHLGEIARGGMGAIIRVRDEALGRDLAMKVVLGDGGRVGTSAPGSGGPLARRFLEEAKITAQLDHPGVVPVHQFGTDGEGRLFFTMKLIDGGRTLGDVFRSVREGKGRADAEFSRTRVLQIFVRVLETLAFAHQKGILHRDLKPANVMVGNFGEVYVMDWGLAKASGVTDDRDLRASPAADAAARDISGGGSDGGSAGSASSGSGSGASLTEVGQVLGTPTYMPIEQARGETLDARADVYAVGAMLYELLAGSPPFGEDGRARSGPEVLHRLLKGGPDPIARVATDVPPELVSITEKAMAREREARYASALDFARDLQSFLEGRVVRAHETGAWAELRKWVARNRALAGSLCAAVLLLVAGLVAFAFENRAARRNAQRANENAQRANENALAAEAAATDAERARATAQHHAERMTRLAYASLVGRASAALSQGDGPEAARHLAQCPQELRGWEWDMLARRAGGDHEPLVLDVPHDYHDAVAFGAGGRMGLAGGPSPQRWIVHDLASNRTVGRAEPVGHAPDWISFSPDGTRFVTTGRGDEDVRLWETESGKLIARAERHAAANGSAEAAVFSPDGRFVAAGGVGGVEILRASDLVVVRAMPGVNGWGIGWSPDGRRLVATDSEVRDADARPALLFDVESGAVLARGPVVRRSRIVAFSPDGARVLLPMTLQADTTASQVSVHDAATLSRVAVLGAWRGDGSAFLDAVAWDPTGTFVATMASNDAKGLLRIFETARYGAVAETSMLRHAHALEFSPDGSRIRAGGCFGALWDLAIGDLTDRVAVSRDPSVRDGEAFVEFVRDGTHVVLGGREGRVRSIDLTTGETAELATGIGKVYHLAAAAKGDRVWAATATGLWELPLGGGAGAARRLDGEAPRSYSAIAASSDGRWVVGGTGDFTSGPATGEELRILDLAGGSSRTEPAFETDVVCADFAPGTALVAAISGGTRETGHEIGVYDAGARSWRWRIRAGKGDDGDPESWSFGRCVAFAADGRVLYTGTLDGTIAAWSADTGARLASRQLSTGRIRDIRPSADGARLFVVGDDQYVHVLEPATLEPFDALDVGGQGVNRDSEGWGLAVHTGDITRVAVTRQMGNLVLLAPRWTTDSVRNLCRDRDVSAELAPLHARLGFSGAVLDALAATGVAPARLDTLRARLRAMDRPARLNDDAWKVVRHPLDDPSAVASAVRRTERCIELAPEDASALNTLGVAYYRAGRHEEAVAALERSREANRREGAALPTDTLFLAMALHRTGDTDRAAALLDDARVQLTEHLDAWVGTSALAPVLRDEMMRHWAEAERLIHGTLPPGFGYDLSQPPLELPR